MSVNPVADRAPSLPRTDAADRRRSKELSMHISMGLVASITLAAVLALFALSMGIGQASLSYAASLGLSWAYVVLAASLLAETTPGGQSAGLAGLAFAAMYSGLVTVVYFVQLTTVARAAAAPDVLAALSYEQLGSLMFNLDLLGYALMSVSTFFVGLSMRPIGTSDRVLQVLLLVHGIFAPVCVLLPMLDVFGAMPREGGNAVGIMVLVGWCVYFAPIALLSVAHYYRRAAAAA